MRAREWSTRGGARESANRGRACRRRVSTASLFAILVMAASAQAQIMWTEGGVSLTISGTGRVSPVMVADGTGGTITAWQDTQTLPSQIRAQRLDRDGDRLWSDEGAVVCADSTPRTNLFVADDHSGGAVILWQNSPPGQEPSISGQRLDWAGHRLWAHNGVPLRETAALSGLSSISESSFCICYYEHASPYDLRLQRFLLEGNEVLPGPDVQLQPSGSNLIIEPKAVAGDGQNGAYVV